MIIKEGYWLWFGGFLSHVRRCIGTALSNAIFLSLGTPSAGRMAWKSFTFWRCTTMACWPILHMKPPYENQYFIVFEFQKESFKRNNTSTCSGFFLGPLLNQVNSEPCGCGGGTSEVAVRTLPLYVSLCRITRTVTLLILLYTRLLTLTTVTVTVLVGALVTCFK